jgi:hypothetical protein
VQTDEWYVHDRLFKANFEDKRAAVDKVDKEKIFECMSERGRERERERERNKRMAGTEDWGDIGKNNKQSEKMMKNLGKMWGKKSWKWLLRRPKWWCWWRKRKSEENE